MNFKILLVNGQDLSGSSQREAIAAFEAASEPISVVLTRGGSGAPSAPMFKGVEAATQTELPSCHNCHCEYTAFSERCKSLAKSLTALMRFQKSLQRQSKRIETPIAAISSDEDDLSLTEEDQEMWRDSIQGEMDSHVGNETLHNDGIFSPCYCEICLIGESRGLEECYFEDGDLEDVSNVACTRYKGDFNSSLKGPSCLSCTDTNGKDSGVGRTDESISNSEKGSPANTLLSPVDEDSFDTYSTKSDSDACVSANHEFFFEKYSQPSTDMAPSKRDPIVHLSNSVVNSHVEDLCSAFRNGNMLELLQKELEHLDIVGDKSTRTQLAGDRNNAVTNRVQCSSASPRKLPYVSMKEGSESVHSSFGPGFDEASYIERKKDNSVLHTDNTSSAYNTGESFSCSSVAYDPSPAVVNGQDRSDVSQYTSMTHASSGEDIVGGKTDCEGFCETTANRHFFGRNRTDVRSDEVLELKAALSDSHSNTDNDSAPSNLLKSSSPPICKQTPASRLNLKAPATSVATSPEKMKNSTGNQSRKASRQRIFSAGAGQINALAPPVTSAAHGDKARRHKSSSDVVKTDPCGTGNVSGDPSAEWKVRVRSDGTRYVTKRTMRERMLKEREARLTKERTGLTTDDDVMTEFKLGRHWSKQEKKRHLDRVREYKRRKQLMEQSRMSALRESANEDDIVQLSNKKMLKHKNRKILDNFMTVQEILAHGSRSVDDAGQNNLLNVTYI